MRGQRQRRNLAAILARLFDDLAAYLHRPFQDGVGVLLDHAGSRRIDLERQVLLPRYMAVARHQGRAGPRGAGVDGQDHVFVHSVSVRHRAVFPKTGSSAGRVSSPLNCGAPASLSGLIPLRVGSHLIAKQMMLAMSGTTDRIRKVFSSP